jgi:hypothetical protein
MSFDYGNPAGGRTDMVQKPKLDGFVKSQIGLPKNSSQAPQTAWNS